MRLLLISVLTMISMLAHSQVWVGGSSGNWNNVLNWTVTPVTSRTFNSGGSVSVTSVPGITTGGLYILNNTHVSLTPTALLSATFFLTSTLYIEPGSSLTLKTNSGRVINITMGGSSDAEIGGNLTFEGGIFDLGDNRLLLHTNSTPINGVASSFTLGSASNVEFGEAGNTSGDMIIIPDDIFSSDPQVETIVINRTNGVQLGNQPFTVTDQATFTLGDIHTNDNGRLIFSSTALNPAEIHGSAIVGYAEMESRAISTGALDFLGANISSGEDIGNVSLTRRTGSVGENTFNGNSSVSSTWDISVSSEPSTTGRLMSLAWLPDMDNSVNISNDFQKFVSDGLGGWDGLGSLASLSIISDWRITTPVAVFSISGTLTVADENNVLPVSIAGLKARNAKGKIEITWQTLSEIQNDYFILEKQLAGAFSPIGKIGGAGNSNDLIEYKGVDNDPAIGQNVYRLKQVDLDGSITYYGPVSCDYRSGNLRLVAYPNPVINGAASYVMFTADDELIMNLRLVNYLGQEFMNKEIKSNEAYVLPSADLQNGMYKLIATDPFGQKIAKSIVISD
ncbi:hypothetical protein [Fulvivirga ligni]|uniref:hypothetical protein n=1 Tax=Fulvivirga ligni TaxID=2904246 RepID=UPI001F3A828B|nr:hypothetical protein [Fulvivirga ligni]UII22377.1 hypothetical protein LVD16_03920 [Fulvivirga ligni]